MTFKLRFLLLLFTFLTVAKADAQYLKLDQKNGFRDLTFGIPAESITGLVPYNQSFMPDKLVKVFTRPSDKLQIGIYSVINIQYAFYKNQLYEVTISMSKGYVSDGVKDVLIREYGQGEQVGKIGMAWLGQTATMSFSDWQSEFAFVTISNNRLKDQHDYEERANFKPVPSGL